MFLKTILRCLLLALLLSGCRSFSENAKFGLNSGYYTASTKNKIKHRAYVYVQEDTLNAFSADSLIIPFPETVPVQKAPPVYHFQEYSFDLDVLAIPFKYRPTAGEVPRQLSTQFNGAFYTGLRTDRFTVHYHPTPLGIANRDITHFGFSVGYFTGVGAEPVNPLVTGHNFADEYDGVVWLNGVGAFIGINDFTFGVGVGIDYLLDSNRKIWVYQGRPWTGLAVGLNIN